eukprot:TRINITY_DN69600_c0_g1_i1.p1 TRINITY_DN69600_c0_g1~~TRINITY_DN69600_c0_g1_i1.p1  ORF type:complete len:293 (+),score=35.67 TRINITY_DN69600_c0_g1_i1:92-970(+)
MTTRRTKSFSLLSLLLFLAACCHFTFGPQGRTAPRSLLALVQTVDVAAPADVSAPKAEASAAKQSPAAGATKKATGDLNTYRGWRQANLRLHDMWLAGMVYTYPRAVLLWLKFDSGFWNEDRQLLRKLFGGALGKGIDEQNSVVQFLFPELSMIQLMRQPVFMDWKTDSTDWFDRWIYRLSQVLFLGLGCNTMLKYAKTIGYYTVGFGEAKNFFQVFDIHTEILAFVLGRWISYGFLWHVCPVWLLNAGFYCWCLIIPALCLFQGFVVVAALAAAVGITIAKKRSEKPALHR